MQIQHGDVLLKPMDKLPSGCKRQEREGVGLVIARGEMTGHNHVITDKGATVWMLEKNGVSNLYLEVAEPVVITHEEHKPLEIPTGIYEIGRVKEYDYLAEMERRVVD